MVLIGLSLPLAPDVQVPGWGHLPGLHTSQVDARRPKVWQIDA